MQSYVPRKRVARKAPGGAKPYAKRARGPSLAVRQFSRTLANARKFAMSVPRNPLEAHAHFDAGRASSTDTLHVPMSFGNYLPLQAITRSTISSGLSGVVGKQFLVIQFTPTNCSLFQVDGTSGVVTQTGSTQLANSVPNQVRILRQSLQIVNTTVFTQCTGSVRAVSIPEPINWQWSSTTLPAVTAGVLNTLQNIVDTNPATKTYAAAELLKSHTWVIPPSSFQSYIEYFDYQTLSAGGIQTCNALSFNYPPQTSAGTVFGPPSACMNTLVVEFNPSTTSNNYDLTLYQEIAAKFSADTIYQNMHISPKYTSMDEFQRKALHVSKNASAGVPTEQLGKARSRSRGMDLG